MSKVNSGSPGCRAMVMAGKYLSGPSWTSAGSSRPKQREMRAPPGRAVSSSAAGTGGRTAALAPLENLGYVAAAERHALPNRSLIYRDVKAFLNEVGGNPREARYWLTQFQRATSAQSPAFAVLEVGDPFTHLQARHLKSNVEKWFFFLPNEKSKHCGNGSWCLISI